jgi:flagellar basal body-associated protein FliL
VVGVVAQVAADSGDDASRRLSWVIIALVVLAVVIAVATVVFWRLTRPDARTAGGGVRWVPDESVSAPPSTAPPSITAPPLGGDGSDRGSPPPAG